MLTLGLSSAKSHLHVQLIRAELSSNGSSEPLSESLSKLSSHQIPSLSEGTTTAKGLYANIFFVLSHYALRGRQCSVLALSTQHSTSTAGSNRRVPPPRGSSSQVHLGHPLPPALAVWVSLVRGVSSRRGAAACGSTFPVGPLSLLRLLRHPSCDCLCASTTCSGADGCVFPFATVGLFKNRIGYVIVFARLFCGASVYLGGQT